VRCCPLVALATGTKGGWSTSPQRPPAPTVPRWRRLAAASSAEGRGRPQPPGHDFPAGTLLSYPPSCCRPSTAASTGGQPAASSTEKEQSDRSRKRIQEGVLTNASDQKQSHAHAARVSPSPTKPSIVLPRPQQPRKPLSFAPPNIYASTSHPHTRLTTARYTRGSSSRKGQKEAKHTDGYESAGRQRHDGGPPDKRRKQRYGSTSHQKEERVAVIGFG